MGERASADYAQPRVAESMLGMLTELTDPILSPLTYRLAPWFIPTAGR